MEIYLDHAATTYAYDEAAKAVSDMMTEEFGNPSSLHMKGIEAEQKVKWAKETLAKTLKVTPAEILITSGGTESNNLALQGGALAKHRRGNHIITTCFEHASVHQPLCFLEEQGYRVTYLKVNRQGQVEIDQLNEALCDDTILVSIMAVNNEVGTITNLETVVKTVKTYNPEILVHTDAIQAYGKIALYPARLGIDLLSVSAHKIHGPKGVGLLYINKKIHITPLIYGGGQQKGMRSGTENVPGIVGFAVAAEKMFSHLSTNAEHMYDIKSYMIEQLTNEIPEAVIHACQIDHVRETAPHVLSVAFKGVKSEVLLHALEQKGIYVSSGSACSSNHPGISGTLKAIHVDDSLLDSTLRFSFCETTSRQEIDETIKALKEILPILTKFTKQ